jgi:hypothetical protein
MYKGIRFTDEFKQDAVAQVVERGCHCVLMGSSSVFCTSAASSPFFIRMVGPRYA